MHRSRFTSWLAGLLAIAIPALGACDGDASLSFTSTAKFVYVTDNALDEVRGYEIDMSTGALTELGGSPYVVGMGPNRAVASKVGNYLLVTHDIEDSVRVYAVDPDTGDLIEAAGSPHATPPTSLAAPVALSARNDYAYVGNFGTNNISAFSLDASTGAMNELGTSPFPLADSPSALGVTADGFYLYANGISLPGLEGFAIDPDSGVLSPVPGSPFSQGAQADDVTIDPLGRFAYMVDNTSAGVWGFIIDGATGTLSPTPVPFTAIGGFNAESFVDPSGTHLYVRKFFGTTLDLLEIQADGSLQPGNPPTLALSTTFGRSNFEPSGRFFFAPDQISPGLAVYERDPDTGNMVEAVGSPYPIAGGTLRHVAVVSRF